MNKEGDNSQIKQDWQDTTIRKVYWKNKQKESLWSCLLNQNAARGSANKDKKYIEIFRWFYAQFSEKERQILDAVQNFQMVKSQSFNLDSQKKISNL
jgi:FixJ family two-component response regulator